MILKSVCAKWIGPFDGSSSLELDDDITVITGPNDVGKTLLLRAIQLACTSQSLSEAEANIDRYGDSKVRWQQDDDISISATFKLSEGEATPRAVKNLSPESVLNLVRKPAPEISKTRATIPGSPWSTNDFQEIAAIMPKVLYLPS